MTDKLFEVIAEFKDSARLRARFVGNGPTYEWTGEAVDGLSEALEAAGKSFTCFRSDVKGQALYGKICIEFVTFGEVFKGDRVEA